MRGVDLPLSAAAESSEKWALNLKNKLLSTQCDLQLSSNVFF